MEEQNKYIAHLIDTKCEQTLIEHSNNVASLCAGYSCNLVSDISFLAGQLHDIGKYSEAFQHRIRGSSIQVEHALGGAVSADYFCHDRIAALLLKYVIIGHHSGLPDGGNAADLADSTTLQGRLKRDPEDYSAYKGEISPPTIESSHMSSILALLIKEGRRADVVEVFAFFTRYIFSCLTDADFLDTERFYNPDIKRGFGVDFSVLLSRLNTRISTFIPDTLVKKARSSLLAQVCENAKEAGQINVLNMPTGSGKTLTSLAIALQIAQREHKKRIIYVIPFTSIIEQTAQEFNRIFEGKVTVLEHHSNFDYCVKSEGGKEEQSTSEKLKKASENWDCPIIITTNVQFFESLYHYRGSKLRKMHNLSDAVIVFDEIHMIPTEYLQPCLRAIAYVTEYLNSKAIFLSATMPDFDQWFKRYIPGSHVKNLISDRSCFSSFKNTSIYNIGQISLEGLATRITGDTSTLVVTGTKKSARALYKIVGGKKYHLSTYMTPTHRSKVIMDIKAALKNSEAITVVSTSLIEAGVDLDFETVFREAAGIESILQSAGRCNREGKLKTGNVYVYISDEKFDGDMQVNRSIAINLMEKYPDIADESCISEYFDRLYKFNESRIDKNSIAFDDGMPVSLNSIPFRKYAEKFMLIDTDTVAIVINNNEESNLLLRKLGFGNMGVKRSLQKYSVSVRMYEFQNALKLGLVHEENGVFVLSDNRYYSNEYGLSLSEQFDLDYIQ